MSPARKYFGNNCASPSCGEAAARKMFCEKHYMRLYRHGTLDTNKADVTLDDIDGIKRWLESHVEVKESGCWIWRGVRRTENEDYGRINVKGRRVRAHRLSAYAYNGFDLDSKALILHSCDTPSCIQPLHLRAGTQKENCLDKIERGRSNAAIGERNCNAIFTCDSVKEIRRRRALGESTVSLWHAFGGSYTNIKDICRGRTWKHV